MKKVGVFVVGAGKSGTTYIYDKFSNIQKYMFAKKTALFQ